jgi:hypothetical protein
VRGKRSSSAARYPRRRFKENVVEQYFNGFAHKPETTYGIVNAVFCERFIAGFKSPKACDLIAASPLQDSE